MENINYNQLKDYLTGILKTAKKLGLNVQPGGGYSMGYDINRLPPYPVGLFGAISIVEGPGARCKLGLTFEQTESLEAGFNGCMPTAQNKKKKKRRNFKPDMELMRIGAELTLLFQKQQCRPSWESYGQWDEPAAIGGVGVKAKPVLKKKPSLGDKILQEKKKIMGEKLAQPAPQPANEEIVEKIMALADAMADNKALQEEIKMVDKAQVEAAFEKVAKAMEDMPAFNKHVAPPVNPDGEQNIVFKVKWEPVEEEYFEFNEADED